MGDVIALRERKGKVPTNEETVTYPRVLASFFLNGDQFTCESQIVLRDLGPNADMRFVTHMQNIGDGSHYWGHYFDNLVEARANFLERCQRWHTNYGRQYKTADKGKSH